MNAKLVIRPMRLVRLMPKVQDYLATCGCYRSASYAQWEPEDKADPWLIAAAKVLHATIVTNEQAVKPTRNQPLKREPKIPDVRTYHGFA